MATSADWSAWLQQGSGQPNPLAPLNQQYAPLSTPSFGTMGQQFQTAAPAQGQGQTTIATPADWNTWKSPAGYENNPFGTMGLQSTPTPAPDEAAQVIAENTAKGNLPAGARQQAAQPNLTMPSDNATNGPVNRDWQHWEDLINQNGNLGGQSWNGSQWQGGGPVAAGTYILGGKVRTWVNYDANKDTFRNTLNGGPESTWHMVNRWTADNVRSRGMTEQQAYNAALIELKRQFNAAKRDLNTSGFDLSNVPDSQSTDGGGGIGTTPPPRTDSNTPFTPTPAATQQPGQQTPLPAPAPQAGAGGGGTAPGFFADEGTVSAAAQSPEAALLAFQRSQGGVNKSGPFGKYRESLMGKALQAYLGAYGVGGNTGNGGALNNANVGIQEMLSRLSSGQGVGNFLRDTTSKAMNGIDFSNMDSEQIQNILGLVGGAATFGSGPMGQYAVDNMLADLKYQADQQGLFEPFKGAAGEKAPASVLANAASRKKFEDLMRQYNAMR